MIDTRKDLAYLAIKAALGVWLALSIDRWVGNPDSVSSAFVAVLAISPVVLVGLRLAWSQLLASILGGVCGGLALELALPSLAGVPLAVGMAIVVAYLLRVASAYPVTAFTALYVVLVPRGTPFETVEVRLLAVTIGAFAGFVVNVTISALFYRGIFRDRVARAERATRALLASAVEADQENVEDGFARLTHLLSGLHQAKAELRWRGAAQHAATIAGFEARVEHLRYLLHLSCRLGFQARETGLDAARLAELSAWLGEPDTEPPAVAPALEATLGRLLATLATLESDIDSIAPPWARAQRPPAAPTSGTDPTPRNDPGKGAAP